MSAPLPTGAVHLLAADDLLTEAYRYPRLYMALCGELLSASSLAHATCPDDECDCEVRYCRQCVREATGWNAEVDENESGPVLEIRS